MSDFLTFLHSDFLIFWFSDFCLLVIFLPFFGSFPIKTKKIIRAHSWDEKLSRWLNEQISCWCNVVQHLYSQHHQHISWITWGWYHWSFLLSLRVEQVFLQESREENVPDFWLSPISHHLASPISQCFPSHTPSLFLLWSSPPDQAGMQVCTPSNVWCQSFEHYTSGTKSVLTGSFDKLRLEFYRYIYGAPVPVFTQPNTLVAPNARQWNSHKVFLQG